MAELEPTAPVSTPWYLSKRFYLNVLGIVAALLPVTSGFIEQYMGEAAVIWGTLNVILGVISKGAISLK